MSLYYVDEMDFSSGVVDREQWLSSFRFIIVDIVDSEHKFRDVEVMQEITRGVSSYVVICDAGTNQGPPELRGPDPAAARRMCALFVHAQTCPFCLLCT